MPKSLFNSKILFILREFDRTIASSNAHEKLINNKISFIKKEGSFLE